MLIASTEIAKAMSNPLALFLICWLVWVPASCLAEEPLPPSGDVPDWQLSLHDWRLRVEDARQRAEAFIADARTRQTETLPSMDDQANAMDDRLMNDENLQPGDIVSTSKGLFVFVGRRDSPRTPGDFQPVETIQSANTVRK